MYYKHIRKAAQHFADGVIKEDERCDNPVLEGQESRGTKGVKILIAVSCQFHKPTSLSSLKVREGISLRSNQTGRTAKDRPGLRDLLRDLQALVSTSEHQCFCVHLRAPLYVCVYLH